MWKEILWNETLEHEGEPVLLLCISLPAPEDEVRPLRRAGRYYARMGEAWKSRWRTRLYPQACAALQEARENSRPFQLWRAELSYRVTLEEESLTSLRVDAAERRGTAPGLTVRRADTWDMKTGLLRTLPSLFPPGVRWKQPLKEELRRQTEAKLASKEYLLFPDARDRVSSQFSPERFYLSGENLILFYPMCSLGSPVEGVAEFSLPLSAFSQGLPQKKRRKSAGKAPAGTQTPKCVPKMNPNQEILSCNQKRSSI